MFKASEIQILLLGLAVAPLLWWMYSSIRWSYRRWLGATLAAILVSYSATVVEGVAFESLFNLVEHVGYAVTGVCFALACVGFVTTRAPVEGEEW